MRRSVAVVAFSALIAGVAASQIAPREAAHWPAGTVIRVWIDPDRAPAGADKLVERAMSTWTRVAEGRLKLERTATEQAAGLRVHFIRAGGLYGETRPIVDPATGAIVKADVGITAEIAGDVLDQRIVIFLTALHEIGHALGLGHTDDFDTIMYRFQRPDDGSRYFGAYRNRIRSAEDIGTEGAPGLATGDVQALKALYAR